MPTPSPETLFAQSIDANRALKTTVETKLDDYELAVARLSNLANEKLDDHENQITNWKNETKQELDGEITRIDNSDRHRVIYVDQQAGNDNSNDYGKPEGALKSLRKACDQVPLNASARILLVSDYDTSKDPNIKYPFGSNMVSVEGVGSNVDGNPPIRIKLDYFVDGSNNRQFKSFFQKIHGGISAIKFTNVGFDFPEIKEDEGVTHKPLCSIVSNYYHHGGPALIQAGFFRCDFNVPENGVGFVVGSAYKTLALSVIACTFTENMRGHWVSDCAAGTKTTDARNVISNLGVL